MQISSEYLMSPGGMDLLNKIFSGAGEGILIVNEKGEIKLLNSRAEQIFLYENNELTGRKIEDLIPENHRHGHSEKRNEFIKHPVARPMGIGRHLTGLRKNGEIFPVEVSLSYVMHENEKLVIVFISDITKRKEQEDALAQNKKKLEEYATELESMVKERTQELEHLNLGLKSQIRERKLAEAALKESLEDLKKAEREILHALNKEKELNEMKSRFISMASHEFRTPLTTINSSASLIARYHHSEDQPSREKHISRIKTSVQNLTNILNDFLSLEKLESGSLNVKLEKFTLPNALHEVFDLFELNLKSGQKIELNIQEGLPDVYSDPHILKNVIINLTSNAIKYSSEGKTIGVSVSAAGGNIKIAIRDEGIGIPKEEQKNLFSRFFRAENASNIQGTGLGLNIVKRYLDLIGGCITFVSEENRGSEFTITFPVKI